MPDFTIYTESKADVKFLNDFIAEVFNNTLPENNFDTLLSWSGYKAGGVLKTEIQQNFDEGNETIIILDADADFKGREREVSADFAAYKIPIRLFLFPDNLNVGNIETLLAGIATDRKLMDCFLEYEKCVALYPKKLNDSRIYSYLDMLLLDNWKDEKGKDLRREEFRNYRNKNHWDLKHTDLNPLKEFLASFL